MLKHIHSNLSVHTRGHRFTNIVLARKGNKWFCIQLHSVLISNTHFSPTISRRNCSSYVRTFNLVTFQLIHIFHFIFSAILQMYEAQLSDWCSIATMSQKCSAEGASTHSKYKTKTLRTQTLGIIFKYSLTFFQKIAFIHIYKFINVYTPNYLYHASEYKEGISLIILQNTT